VLTLEALDAWQQQARPIVNPIKDLFDECSGWKELLARASAMQEVIDFSEVMKQLRISTAKARVAGNE